MFLQGHKGKAESLGLHDVKYRKKYGKFVTHSTASDILRSVSLKFGLNYFPWLLEIMLLQLLILMVFNGYSMS